GGLGPIIQVRTDGIAGTAAVAALAAQHALRHVPVFLFHRLLDLVAVHVMPSPCRQIPERHVSRSTLGHSFRHACPASRRTRTPRFRRAPHDSTRSRPSARPDDRWVYYALNREALDEIAEFASDVKPGKHAGSCARACCG